MYPHQGERLTEALDREGLDALVASAPANVAYVTGFRSLAVEADAPAEVFAVFAPQGTALVAPTIDAAAIATEGVDADHVVCHGRFFYDDAEARGEVGRRVVALAAEAAADAAEALAQALARLGVVRGAVGLDDARLPHEARARLAERLAAFALRPASGALAAARAVKGPWEIECLARALAIAEEAIDAVLAALRPGVTEREALAVFEREVARRGARAAGASIVFGPDSALPAACATDRALRAGDLARLDGGATFKGYRSHVARTAVAGEPDARVEARFGALLAGLEAAIGALEPGAAAGAVFERAVEAVRKAGLPGYRCHHVGHGIGLEAAEAPWLAPDGPALETGMVLGVETPYYAPGAGGMNVKDTLLVTRSGARCLNRSNRGLIVLD